MKIEHIRPAAPRQTAQIRLDDGTIWEGPVGAPLEDFVAAIRRSDDPPIVAALVDGELRELTWTINQDADVQLLSNATSDGKRIYQRSLTLLMLAAVRELFPQAQIMVDHSITMTGLLCEVRGAPPFTPDDVARVEALMRQIVDQDERIVKSQMPLDEAIAMFKAQGDEDKARLLAFRQKGYVVIYSLRQVRDYFYGYMVPSTGYLAHFDLLPHMSGFVLRSPRRSDPLSMPTPRDATQLDRVFRQYGEWLGTLQVDDVGALNEAIRSERIREVVLVSEALHEQQIVHIAAQIAERRDVRLVLIAGPSSSGKTTFSRRLAIQLRVRGLRPLPVEMDNYFVERALTPRDENGDFDFEHLHALDLELFNRDMLALMAGQQVRMPHYNFQSGTRQVGAVLQASHEHVIIAEGIHGLNPDLIRDIPPERIYRIYISALTQLNLDHHNRIPTTDSRLLRRIVRDARTRGYSAADTINRWESVRRGETRWIFPYQENADAMFNSALVYEMAVLKPFVEPLLHSVEPNTLTFVECKRLLAFLQWFLPCPVELTPDNSILREFIGGSILDGLVFSS